MFLASHGHHLYKRKMAHSEATEVILSAFLIFKALACPIKRNIWTFLYMLHSNNL